MAATQADGALHCTYELRDGHTSLAHYGLDAARFANFPADVVQDAHRLVQQLASSENSAAAVDADMRRLRTVYDIVRRVAVSRAGLTRARVRARVRRACVQMEKLLILRDSTLDNASLRAFLRDLQQEYFAPRAAAAN